MKFTTEHYQDLLDRTKKLSEQIELEQTLDKYITESIGENSKKRFVWDCFWATKWHKDNKNLSYRDSHIETAMVKALNEVMNIKGKLRID